MVLRVVMVLVLCPAAARADSGFRFGGALEAGVQGRPSDCSNYCDSAVGGGLELMIGSRVAPRHALMLEVSAFSSTVTFADEPDGLSGAIAAGVEWAPDPRFWLRGAVGGGLSLNHNSDGGPGGGAAFLGTAAVGWMFSAHMDVRARLRLYAHQSGFTPVATLGLGITL